ncbi:MAG: dTDP-4-dehydrorhamnose 3,5-epimerase [Bacteroidetes bacterium]|nr:dTDP-4-dehydrorhamnose 3,5-epimerase [Bacteroidota bacterium]
MHFIDTNIPDLKVFEPTVFEDSRGYFFESYNAKVFKEEAGITSNFVQDNHSKSSFGVLRGLHYQLEPHAQAKIVCALHGEVLDVAVDIRKGSPTYGRHFSVVLSDDNKKQLYIPKGFAHGFAVLTETAVFAYKCDGFYAKEYEAGIIYNDPALNIDWQIDTSNAIVSDKDKELPLLENAENNFEYQKQESGA